MPPPVLLVGSFSGGMLGDLLCESGTARYSTWAPALGDTGVFGCRAIAVKSNFLNFLIAVETKKVTDIDTAASSLGYLPNVLAVGTVKGAFSGLKDLFRYRYEVQSDPPAGSEWVHFQMIEPSWQSN